MKEERSERLHKFPKFDTIYEQALPQPLNYEEFLNTIDRSRRIVCRICNEAYMRIEEKKRAPVVHQCLCKSCRKFVEFVTPHCDSSDVLCKDCLLRIDCKSTVCRCMDVPNVAKPCDIRTCVCIKLRTQNRKAILPCATKMDKEESIETVSEFSDMTSTNSNCQTSGGQIFKYHSPSDIHSEATPPDIYLSSYYLSEEESIIEPAYNNWPRVYKFSVEKMKERIRQFCQSWKISEYWRFLVSHVQKRQKQLGTDVHDYEVIFTMPEISYPCYQASASVLFNVEVNYMCPYNMPVEVFYYFEGSRLKYTPSEQIYFQEKLLRRILDTKINFYKFLTY